MPEGYSEEFLDSLDVGVSIIDRAMRIEWINKAMRKKGFEIESIKGRPCHVVYRNSQKLCDSCPSAEVFKTGKVVKVIEKGADGKDYEVTATPIKEKGKAIKVIEFVREMISERPSGSQILDGIKRMGNTFDFIEDLLFIIDKDFNLIYVNRQFRKLFGKDCIGRKCHQIVHGRNSPIEGCPFMKSKRTRKTEKLEFFHPKLKRWLLVTSNPIFDEKGGVAACLHFVKDITDRKNVEEELKESEKKFRSLVEVANEGIAIVQDRLVKYANPYLKRLIGMSPAEALGKPFMKFVHPSEAKKLLERYTKRMRGGYVPSIYETALLHRDGKKVPIELNASRIIYEKRPADLVIMRDITARKKVEGDLKESESRFKLLFDESPQGILVADAKTKKFFMANSMILRMLGWKKSEIERLSVEDIHPKKDLPYVLQEFKKQAEGKKRLASELPVKRKDGSVFFADVYAYPIELQGKKYLIGLFSDVTERKKAEEALRQSEERYRLIFESSSSVLAQIDTTGTIIGINRRIEDLGYTKEYLIGKKITGLGRIFTDESIARMAAAFAKRIAGIDVKPYSVEGRKRDGEPFTLEIQSVPLKDKEGKIMGELAILFDVTEKKKAEEELKRAYEELKQIDTIKSNILRDVSHELKTPVSTVSMATNMMIGEMKKSYPRSQKIMSYLDMLRRSSKRFGEEVDSILEFSRLQSTKDIEKTSFSLCPLVNKVIMEDGPVSRGKDVRIANLVDKRCVIKANYPMMKSMLKNLIINAVKFTDKGKVVIWCRKDKKGTTISVRDTGKGINKEDIDKLFKPFTQIDPSRSGLGIGLAIVKRIVELHHGTIDIKSKLGKGSTFMIALPPPTADD